MTSSRTSDCFSAYLLEAPRICSPDIRSFSAMQKPGILQGILLQESVIFIPSHPFYWCSQYCHIIVHNVYMRVMFLRTICSNTDLNGLCRHFSNVSIWNLCYRFLDPMTLPVGLVSVYTWMSGLGVTCMVACTSLVLSHRGISILCSSKQLPCW